MSAVRIPGRVGGSDQEASGTWAALSYHTRLTMKVTAQDSCRTPLITIMGKDLHSNFTITLGTFRLIS